MLLKRLGLTFQTDKSAAGVYGNPIAGISGQGWNDIDLEFGRLTSALP